MRRATCAWTGDRLSWVRRSRIGGDNWSGTDIPLGEDREEYLLRLSQDGRQIHEAQTSAPSFDLGRVDDLQRGSTLTVEVAQISMTYGYGPFARRDFDVE